MKMHSGGVAKPAHHAAVFGFYDLAWHENPFIGEECEHHKRTLREDLVAGFQRHNVDVMLLSECGAVEEGLGEEFHDLLKQICGPDFSVTCQSHFACIVRTSRIHVLTEPSLTEALSSLQEQVFRKCQHLQVSL